MNYKTEQPNNNSAGETSGVTINWKRKLSSRKLWAAICGLIVGIAAAFGLEENDYARIAGVITSAISVISYIFGEAEVDAARAKSGSSAHGSMDAE